MALNKNSRFHYQADGGIVSVGRNNYFNFFFLGLNALQLTLSTRNRRTLKLKIKNRS